MKQLAFILLFLPIHIFAQKSGVTPRYPDVDNDRGKTYFFKGRVEVADNDHVVNYLIKQLDFKNQYGINALEFVEMIESPAGFHFTYVQSHYGVPLYGSQVKVNLDKKGKVRSLIDNSYRVTERLDFRFPEKAIADAYLDRVPLLDSVKKVRMFFNNEGRLVPAIQLRIFESDHSYYEVVLDYWGEVLYYQDLNRYFQGQDSTVQAKVFLPDPLTSAEVVYGSPYVDSGDVDIPELNAELVDVSITVDFTNDTFSLKGPWVEIREFSNPVTTPAFSLLPQFNYMRADEEFEDVNCYYHLHEFQLYIQSLGFMNICNYSIGVDAHALNGADNSMYQSNKLYFGEGCVDDAEDADVIIHEYGHAITASAAPNTWVGSERKALDEAIGDYFAVSYGRAINDFNWADMFSWDGHSPDCWNGRTAATTKTYPNNMGNGSHADGEIWSSTIMQIWESLGREATDQLMLQSIYSYAQNITYTDAAYMFLDADSLLNGGANYYTIYYWFEQRGILPAVPTLAGFISETLDAACGDSCNGMAVLTAYGGAVPYTYEWKDSLGVSLGMNDDTATGLCVGLYYTVTITDSLGATVSDTTGVIGYSLSTITGLIITTADSGSGNGTALVSVASTPPNTYLWSDPAAQTTAMASNLVSGNYSVTVTDVLGCTYTDSATVALIISNGPELEPINILRLFPNPTNGQLHFELAPEQRAGRAAVCNLLGEVIKSTSQLTNNSLNLTDLKAGFYLLEIELTSGEFLKSPVFIKSN